MMNVLTPFMHWELDGISRPYHWVVFGLIMTFILVVDLGLFNRKSAEPRFRKALIWCLCCVSLALLFNLAIFMWFGATPALEFLTGYVIEYALSVDNLFVFLVIFSHFGVPKRYQHRVLYYGIVGAIVMRGIFIFLGAGLLHMFEFVRYIFGAILVITGIKLFLSSDMQIDPEKNIFLRLMRALVPSVKSFREEKFFVREHGKFLATPLFFVLISVELTDLIFAMDSIPAIFAITDDPFIVLTSNVFAVLGLRSLYFVLAHAMTKIHYLTHGLAMVLFFVGIKMLIEDLFKIPVWLSLLVIVCILGGAIGASLPRFQKRPKSD